MNPSPAHHETFAIERSYPKPPAKIFAYYSDPAKKRRWLGGDAAGFEVVAYAPAFEVDQVERWKYRFQGGVLIDNDFRYQDIVPDQRIVFVYTMAMGGRRVSSSQVTVELTPSGNGTRLRHTEQGAYFEGKASSQGREQATAGILDLLNSLLEETP